MPRPLAENDFWSLVSTMNGRTDEEALGRLTDALRARPRKDVGAFQERLTRVLYELDREDLASQPVRFRGDPPDEDPIPLSDDSFLYLRAGIVIAGRATYESVLADPTVLADDEWDECEDLLYVAAEVLGDEVDTKVSYETGSNTKHWRARPEPEPEREAWDQGQRPVFVDCRDLAEPIVWERGFADGRHDSFVTYPPPDCLDRGLELELCLTLSKPLSLNGGLPAELDADHIWVLIDFGDEWDVRPEVGDAGPHDELPGARAKPVRVRVAMTEVRGWTRNATREGLLALTASCVLAVLPVDHAARAEIERIRDVGAGHLPA